MNKIRFTTVLALLAAGTLAWAADQQAAQDKPSFYASQSETVSAKVTAINHETREVTLQPAEGDTVTITASDDVRNLDQVSIGDIVVAKYIRSLSIKVVANNSGMEPDAMGLTTVERAEKGAMPGVVAADTQVTTATVVDINLEANTFKLKGPDGTVEEFMARNPENLRKADVGDLVVFTTTEAVALSVEVGAAE